MRLLLDTCTFLWLIADSPDLSSSARELFSDPNNEVFLSPISTWEIVVKHRLVRRYIAALASAISTWEIVVKHRLGRLPLPEPPRVFVPRQRRQHGVESLSLDEEAVLQLARLPDYHKDPFDRILICQAIAHGLALLTPDPAVTQYPVRTLW